MWNKKALWNIWLVNNFKDYIIKKRITWFWFGYNRNNKDHSALIPISNIEKKKLQYFNSKFCSQFAYSIFSGISPRLLSLISKHTTSFLVWLFSFFFFCPRDYWSGVFLMVLGSIWPLTGGLLAKMGSSCRALLKINPNIKYASGLGWKIKIILLFNLFLLLFIGLTALFSTIYAFHCTISTNFYLYLRYFQ